jgi:dTDP-glucose 4,6-dehydratase
VIHSQRILVTGADGFIGSHLVEMCLEKGFRVRVFVFYNSFDSWGWLDRLPIEKRSEIEVFSGDIRDSNRVFDAVKGVDTIFHLAALIGIPYSYHSPESYVDTNIKGTLNILQAARSHSTQKIIITSTSEVYGTADYVPIDEKHPLKAQSPYSATKIAAERIAESFFLSFNTPVVIVRPFNTYGPRQSLRAVIPTIIMQTLSGQREIRLGAVHPTRDFNYVTDTCSGLIEIGKSEQVIGETINIASGKEISIGNLARKIIDKVNPEIKIVSDKTRLRPDKSEVDRLLGSNEKIKHLTGWKSGIELEKGLSHTVRWFQSEKTKYLNKKGIYNL